MAVVRRTDAGQGATIRLEGVCPVEDAETLASLILDDPTAPVDWAACTRLHTAVYQVLLGLRPSVLGVCGDPFIQCWLPQPAQDKPTPPILTAMPRDDLDA